MMRLKMMRLNIMCLKMIHINMMRLKMMRLKTMRLKMIRLKMMSFKTMALPPGSRPNVRLREGRGARPTREIHTSARSYLSAAGNGVQKRQAGIAC